VPSRQLVPVQQPGDQIIIRNEHELPNGVDDIRSGTVALAAPSARQPQLCVSTAHPVDNEHDFPGIGIGVGDHLLNHGADDALFEPRVGGWGGPNRAQILGQRCERGQRRLTARR